ncbi:MAG TPA: hypothetical protein VMW27_28860 [Thermoanaerobaculia bacterium]|nr:hypothetical protein [Thermoanaerobaculia bacterium]
MSAAEMQAYLARLYVDDMFRHLSRLAPELTLAGYKLTEAEREAACGLDVPMLDFFAASLKSKRKKRMTHAFPALFHLDPGGMDRYYDRYVQLYPARPEETVSDDVVAFGRFIETTLACDPDLPPYASEVARYERLYYAMNNALELEEGDVAASGEPPSLPESGQAVPVLAKGVAIAGFTHDVLALAEALRHAREPQAQSAGEQCLVFQKLPRSPSPKVFRVSAGTRMLLDLCDGRRDVEAITVAVERQTGAAGLRDEIAGTLRRLSGLRLLRFR